MNLRMKTSAMILWALGLGLAAAPARASAPALLTYQGRLAEGGVPVSGNRCVALDIFDAPAGGALFAGVAQGVTVANGVFRTTFTVPAGLDLGLTPGSGGYFLEVKVGASCAGLTALSPREQLTSSVYSVYSGTAGFLAASPAADQVQTGSPLKVNPGGPAGFAGLEVAGAAGVNWGSAIGLNHAGAVEWRISSWDDSSLSFTKVSGATFTPLKLKPTGNLVEVMDTASAVSMVVGENRRVGVGLPAPQARLHVSSAAAVSTDTILKVSSGPAAGQEILEVKGDGIVIAGPKFLVRPPGVAAADPGYLMTIGQCDSLGALKVPGPSAASTGMDLASFGGFGRIRVDKGATASGRLILEEDGSVRINQETTQEGSIVLKSTAAAPSLAVLKVQDNAGASVLRVQNNGNVGIGASVATERLQVSGGNINLDDVKKLQWGVAPSPFVQGDDAAGFLALGNAVGEVMRITAGSNVGIGTTIPGSARLAVSGQVRTLGGAPALGAGCGTGAAITGTDVAGRINLGSAAIGTCAITFAGVWDAAPTCVVNHELGTSAGGAFATTSSMTLTGAMAISQTWNYMCIGK